MVARLLSVELLSIRACQLQRLSQDRIQRNSRCDQCRSTRQASQVKSADPFHSLDGIVFSSCVTEMSATIGSVVSSRLEVAIRSVGFSRSAQSEEFLELSSDELTTDLSQYRLESLRSLTTFIG